MSELETPAPSLAEQGAEPGLPQTALDEMRQLAARYPQARSALISMLHLVQSVEGYVTPAGIEACADILELTPAEVAAVATFYTMYKRRPVGAYHVGVCTNTLCAVMGGDLIFERLRSHLDVGNDETTEDGMITLEHIECNAACDYAPVMMVNWEFFDNQTPQSAVELVDNLRGGQVVQATRGARIGDWRAAERVLAGFSDDRADEGPTAGPATLVGLRLAREQGWQAPDPGDDDSSGGPSGHPVGAAQQADTSRAESESEVAASPADTADSAKPAPKAESDPSAGGRHTPKGT
ncbi:MAG: NADH-quinone oxidoreductase subunit [Nocardioidaceae bacterium]|nr:NADH-quinone oxidoreductase subunit [Nocardioidaceae bacterium]